MDKPMCYVASQDGTAGYVAVCVDSPEHRTDTHKFVAECLSDGLHITRVPLDDARAGLVAYLSNRAKEPNNE